MSGCADSGEGGNVWRALKGQEMCEREVRHAELEGGWEWRERVNGR